MSGLDRAWQSLRQQLADNPRLRLGAWLIVGILVFYGWLLIGDGIGSLRSQVQDDQERLAKLHALAGQEVWHQRAEQAAAIKESLLAELPEADTPGLAQAELQSRLRNLFQDFGSAITVEVSAPVALEENPGWLRIPATLSANRLEMERIKRAVQAVEAQPGLMRIESISIRNRSDSTLLNMTVHAYYRQRPETADAP